jgi:hypothetical protein
MKMTWKQYRKECKANNVEPTRADFKGIELSWEQIDARIMRTIRKQQPKAMAATA